MLYFLRKEMHYDLPTPPTQKQSIQFVRMFSNTKGQLLNFQHIYKSHLRTKHNFENKPALSLLRYERRGRFHSQNKTAANKIIPHHWCFSTGGRWISVSLILTKIYIFNIPTYLFLRVKKLFFWEAVCHLGREEVNSKVSTEPLKT